TYPLVMCAGRPWAWRAEHLLSCAAPDRPPLRRASLDTSPPIDGGEEGLSSATAAEDGRTG
ncbi:hypothetical protein FJW07_17475, partial [Mesorhizobium sp. B3-1-9]